MRVLVMDTGRGINAEKVAMWRAHLGLEETDQLVLVSWFAPQAKAPLPVTAHMVCGPVLRLGQEPVHWPVRGPDAAEERHGVAAETADSAHSADTVASEVDEAVTDTAGGLSESELDEQLTEQEADPSQAAAADEAAASPADGAAPADAPASVQATDLSHLPVYDPRRVRQAVRWRRKWAQRRASRFASRQVRRVKALSDGTTHLPSTVVSTVLRPRKDAISWEYALAATRSQTVNALFATADVVAPVDQRSQKAAWLLARRHAGPDVIVTLPAAARAVAARRSAS